MKPLSPEDEKKFVESVRQLRSLKINDNQEGEIFKIDFDKAMVYLEHYENKFGTTECEQLVEEALVNAISNGYRNDLVVMTDNELAHDLQRFDSDLGQEAFADVLNYVKQYRHLLGEKD